MKIRIILLLTITQTIVLNAQINNSIIPYNLNPKIEASWEQTINFINNNISNFYYRSNFLGILETYDTKILEISSISLSYNTLKFHKKDISGAVIFEGDWSRSSSDYSIDLTNLTSLVVYEDFFVLEGTSIYANITRRGKIGNEEFIGNKLYNVNKETVIFVIKNKNVAIKLERAFKHLINIKYLERNKYNDKSSF